MKKKYDIITGKLVERRKNVTDFQPVATSQGWFSWTAWSSWFSGIFTTSVTIFSMTLNLYQGLSRGCIGKQLGEVKPPILRYFPRLAIHTISVFPEQYDIASIHSSFY